MTIPWLVNCSHTDSGWCPDCVAALGDENQRLRAQMPAIMKALHACRTALAVLDRNSVIRAKNDIESVLAALREGGAI